jgi:hypothetical protein
MFRLYMLQATEASLGRASRVVFGMFYSQSSLSCEVSRVFWDFSVLVRQHSTNL